MRTRTGQRLGAVPARTRARRRAARRRRARGRPRPRASPPASACLGGRQPHGARAGAGGRRGGPRRRSRAAQTAHDGVGVRVRPAHAARAPPASGSATLDLEHERGRSAPPARKSSTGSVRSPPAPAERTCASSASSAACRSPRGLSTPGGAHRLPPIVAWRADLDVGDVARPRVPSGSGSVLERRRPASSRRSSMRPPSRDTPASPARSSSSVRVRAAAGRA